jgi:hypothetical protein
MFDPRLLLIAAAALAARTGPAPHANAPKARVVTVVARDYAFDAPDTVAAGRTEVRLLNRGNEAHHAYLMRLDGGKTLDDLYASLRAGGPLPSWTHDVGGPNSPVPGGTSVAVVDLTPGNYALICVIPAADGMPHVMKGMGHAITVVAGTPAPSTKVSTKVGAPDITVDLADYAFTLSRPLTRGHHVIRVRNTAAQSHEMFVARLAPGKTPQDAMAWLESQKGPPPMIPLGGTVGLAHGVTNDIALDLTPGNYALFCFIPDAKDGKPHVAHGMIKPFTVR